jgi:hypothetical protein
MIDGFVSGNLRIEVTEDAGANALRLVWLGKSDARDPATALRPYFTGKVIPAAAAAGRSLEMHFEEIEYFNSSTVSALLQVLAAARQAKVRAALVYDAKRKGQQVTFAAFKALAKRDDLLTLREV